MAFLGPEGRKQMQQFGRVSTVGIELAVSIVIGYLGGEWLDLRFGTEPVLKWLGLGFGMAAGFRSLYRMARETQRKLDADREAAEAAAAERAAAAQEPPPNEGAGPSRSGRSHSDAPRSDAPRSDPD